MVRPASQEPPCGSCDIDSEASPSTKPGHRTDYSSGFTAPSVYDFRVP
jgi:hypothetical protein